MECVSGVCEGSDIRSVLTCVCNAVGVGGPTDADCVNHAWGYRWGVLEVSVSIDIGSVRGEY